MFHLLNQPGASLVVHRLKSRPEFFAPMVRGEKTHDMRRDDRGFRIGDEVVLLEHDHLLDRFSGRQLRGRITYITDAQNPCALSGEGLTSGFCILSLRFSTMSRLIAGIRTRLN
jgi:hypothetical protein